MSRFVITSIMRSFVIILPIVFAKSIVGMVGLMDSVSTRLLIAVSFFLLSFGISLTLNRLTNILRN